MKALEHDLLCLFSQYLMFLFIIDTERGIFSYQIRQLPCRARGARGQFCKWKRFYLFPLSDGLVCTIQSNQTLDALIKFVA